MNASGSSNVNAANVVQITPVTGTNPPVPILVANTYPLLNLSNGAGTGAVLQVTDSAINTTSANPANGSFSAVSPGPAYGLFNGIVDLSGVYTFNDLTDVFQLNFTGLDSSKRYTIALTVNRAQAGGRVMDLDLLDVTSSTEASAGTTTIVSPTHVQVVAEDNTAVGNVAR